MPLCLVTRTTGSLSVHAAATENTCWSMVVLMGHLIWNQRCIILSSRRVTDCKLTAVWLEIEVDSAGRETEGLGLAQVGQHTQEKKTFAVTRLLSAGYHCYDGNGNLVVSALVQAVTAESAPMNAENGAFFCGVVA